MAVWQRPARVGLASFVVAFGIAVMFGIRDRAVTTVAVGVDRDDPDAVIQSRGARIVQTDASAENLRVDAERQLTYPDGSVRLSGVDIVAPARDDRTEFRVTGDTATVMEETGDIELVGRVRLTSGDGLTGATDDASYSDREGIVTMPGAAEFRRSWMRASGAAARYDQRSDILYLEPDALVELRTDDEGPPETRLAADAAVVAQRDGYMRFTGAATVEAGDRLMEADEVRTAFDPSRSQLDAIELVGSARILGRTPVAGRLRQMTAPEIAVGYGADAPERAELAGGARIELFGESGGAGALVASQSMEVGLGGLDELRARGAVVVELPPRDGVGQRIESAALEIGGGGADDTLLASFDDGVAYRERRPPGAGGEVETRVTEARRLEAVVEQGLTGVREARFIGSVSFSAGAVSGAADEATYQVEAGTFTLITLGAAGQTPRVVDRRGSIQAETITVGFAGPDIEATGDVESVLSAAEPGTDEAGDATAVKRPGLLDDGPPIYVTADAFVYEAAAELATYTGGARLWQGATEFRGDTLVLDEATGNVRAEGGVRTRTSMLQNDDATGQQVETSTVARGETLVYDDATRTAVYTTEAELEASLFQLAADTIEVILHDDARTLERILATGEVELELEGRQVSGDTLTYYDLDGRYEMSGRPVRIVETTAGECRETTGRSVTFFLTAEAVTIDGASEVRTASTNGACAALAP